jgi:hypothetical protein
MNLIFLALILSTGIFAFYVFDELFFILQLTLSHGLASWFVIER